MNDRPLVERLHDRRFIASENPHGVSDRETVFHYRLEAGVVTGTYAGGRIRTGHLVGRARSNETVELLYHCVTTDGELMAGRSRGRLSLDERDRLRLDFEWRWLTGEGGGRSRYVELVAAGA